MKKKYLMDSFAIISYLNEEKGYKQVRDHMAIAQEAGEHVLMNEMNVGEVFYTLSRKRSIEDADFFLETMLAALPIALISNSFDNVIDAARIKAEYPLSFADCFIVATAQKEDAVIITGDPEFSKVAHLVEIEWLE